MIGTGSVGRLMARQRERSKTEKRRKRFKDRLKPFDLEAQKTMLTVREFTMISPNRLFSLISSVRYIHRYSIPGKIVECGVWRGGAVMAVALTLGQLGVRDQQIYLYDTFSGMTEPGERDMSVDGKVDPKEIFRNTRTGADTSDWCAAKVEEVKQNLATTGYAPENFVLVQGKVEDTIPGSMPDEISILRLDTDWYSSTRHEMEHLFPRLVSGGVLIVDDYNVWSGSRQAVDEYLELANIPMLLTTVDSSVIGVKL